MVKLGVANRNLDDLNSQVRSLKDQEQTLSRANKSLKSDNQNHTEETTKLQADIEKL